MRGDQIGDISDDGEDHEVLADEEAERFGLDIVGNAPSAASERLPDQTDRKRQAENERGHIEPAGRCDEFGDVAGGQLLERLVERPERAAAEAGDNQALEDKQTGQRNDKNTEIPIMTE